MIRKIRCQEKTFPKVSHLKKSSYIISNCKVVHEYKQLHSNMKKKQEICKTTGKLQHYECNIPDKRRNA